MLKLTCFTGMFEGSRVSFSLTCSSPQRFLLPTDVCAYLLLGIQSTVIIKANISSKQGSFKIQNCCSAKFFSNLPQMAGWVGFGRAQFTQCYKRFTAETYGRKSCQQSYLVA